MRKSVCVFFLCLCLVLTMFPTAAFATGGAYSDYEPGLYCRCLNWVWEDGAGTYISDPDADLIEDINCDKYNAQSREFLYIDADGNATTVRFEDLETDGDYFAISKLQDDFVTIYFLNVGDGGSITYSANGASIPVECYLPKAGYFDEPVRSEDHYLRTWEYDGTNPSIYLVAADGFTLTDAVVDEGCDVTIEIDSSGKYATITLDEVTDSYLDIKYNLSVGNTPAYENWAYISIIDNCPGIYWRWPDLVNGEWVSNPDNELFHNITDTVHYNMIREFFFRDEYGELHKLQASDLSTSDPSIQLTQRDSGFVVVTCKDFVTGYIYYGTYKIRVTAELPALGFYYEPFATEDHYAIEWDPVAEGPIFIVPARDDIEITDVVEESVNNAEIDVYGDYAIIYIDDPVSDYFICTVEYQYDGYSYVFEDRIAIALISDAHYAPSISASASEDHVDVTWYAVPRATKYALYRRANETGSWGSWVPLSTTLTATSYKDTDVVPGAKYQYRAKAFSGEWSEYSNREEVTIPVPVPAAPVIAVNAAPGKNTVSWAAVDHAESYALYRRANENGSWAAWEVLSTQTGTEYVDKATEAGAMYEYRAKAIGKGGSSDYSNRIKVTALAPVPPAAPVISVSATAEKITVQWQAVPDAGKYQVFRREKSDGKWGPWELKYSAKGLVFNDKDVTGGVVYQYRAKAVDLDSGLKSSYSEREMIGLAKPDAPVIKVKASAGKNTVSWAAVTGAKYYVVYWRDNSSGDWSAWTMSGSVTQTSFDHTSVMSGVEYQYRVRASNGVWSDYSNKKSVIAQ